MDQASANTASSVAASSTRAIQASSSTELAFAIRAKQVGGSSPNFSVSSLRNALSEAFGEAFGEALGVRVIVDQAIA